MKNECELIMTIVNRGYAEAAMDAARTAGATGGTVGHGRGTGGKEAKQLLGITIQPEKELILILVERSIRSAVMRAVTEAVGLETDGQGICFSLPVEAVAGVTFASNDPAAEPAADANCEAVFMPEDVNATDPTTDRAKQPKRNRF